MVLQVNEERQGEPLLLTSSPPSTPSTPNAPVALLCEVRVDNGKIYTKRSVSTKKSATIQEDDEDEEGDSDSRRSSHGSSPPQYFELTQVPSCIRKNRAQQPSYRREDSSASGVFHRNPLPEKPRGMSEAVNGLTLVLSALYAKLLVIIGLCFPMAEVISHRIPIGWYEGFYLYLYIGSIFFLLVIYAMRERKHPHKKPTVMMRVRAMFCWTSLRRVESVEKPRFQVSSTESSISDEDTSPPVHFGSFYLRLGAVAFGIGSMIYSGLEFGQFFELESKEHCYSFLYGFTPSSHMAFTFFQLYFIFMNSRVFIQKHNLMARFGLMHMIATNLCVWLHVLIQETKHQITILVHPNVSSTLMPELANNPWAKVDRVVEDMSEDYFDTMPFNSDADASSSSHQISRRSVADHDYYTTHGQCRRSNVIGQLVQDASQFLFPCTIEYSLICAAILYMMWKHTGSERVATLNQQRLRHRSTASTSTVNHHAHHKHQYQVDCAKAHKGLFCGIFLLVVCIISLILFFVLIKKPNYRHLGVLQAHIVELVIYVINAIACLIAVLQIQELRYSRTRNVELDNILLIVAQTGLYVFNMFSIIGAQFFGTTRNTQLVLINAVACLLQATFQTAFILDASRRYCHTTEQVRRKPGREMVTFMLVCNFAMWAINTLETRRADSNPVQMHFYGFWAWTIITHVTTPLTIFYRFHSTVCLCDIWKRVYKLKSDFP